MQYVVFSCVWMKIMLMFSKAVNVNMWHAICVKITFYFLPFFMNPQVTLYTWTVVGAFPPLPPQIRLKINRPTVCHGISIFCLVLLVGMCLHLKHFKVSVVKHNRDEKILRDINRITVQSDDSQGNPLQYWLFDIMCSYNFTGMHTVNGFTLQISSPFLTFYNSSVKWRYFLFQRQ